MTEPNLIFNRPKYWVVNPYCVNYKNIPKTTTCVECYQGIKTKKHNIQTILYDKNEKRYRFNLKVNIINNINNNESGTSF